MGYFNVEHEIFISKPKLSQKSHKRRIFYVRYGPNRAYFQKKVNKQSNFRELKGVFTS